MSRKLRMNHIKSIIIAVITLVVGFVILTIMGMKDDAGKYNVDQLPDRANQKIEVKNKNIKNPKGKIKNTRHIDKEEPIFVKESQPLKKQSGETQHRRENPETMNVDISTQLPRKETKLIFEEEADGSIDYDTHEYIDVKKRNYELISDRNKTISITKNNNTTSITIINKNPVMSQNTSPQQSIRLLNIGVENNTQHPTSTVPNL